MRALPGYRLSCPVTGTPPIHTALIRNSTVLVNSTYIIATIIEEGNYSCLATNEYGTDLKEFSVIFDGETSLIQSMACIITREIAWNR